MPSVKHTMRRYLKRHLLKLWNFYPPFLGAGIRITDIGPEFNRVSVELKKRPWTSNYVGTQFGGSIFMMTDAFFVVMLYEKLGQGYVIWDKAASIKYLKPGLTKLRAEFSIGDELLAQIRAAVTASEKSKIDWIFNVDVKDTAGDVIASVEKTIYIKRKS